MLAALAQRLVRAVTGESPSWDKEAYDQIISKTGAGMGPDAVEVTFVFPAGKKGYDLYLRLCSDDWRHGMAVDEKDKQAVLRVILRTHTGVDCPKEWNEQEQLRRIRVRIFHNFVPDMFWYDKGKDLIRIEALA